MSILNKYDNIMKSNIISLLDQTLKRKEDIAYFLRRINIDLGEVKIEAITFTVEEQQARHNLDECNVELIRIKQQINNLDVSNAGDVQRLNEQKDMLSARKKKYTALLYKAEQNMAKIHHMLDKLLFELMKLEVYQYLSLQKRSLFKDELCFIGNKYKLKLYKINQSYEKEIF